MQVLRSPANQWRGVVRSITIAAALLLGGSLLYSAQAGAPLKTGQPAPAFSGTSAAGAKISLSDYYGKTVVLEWTNHQCPYVRKHYSTNKMQSVQKQATTGGVVWLSIVSSAPGREGYVEPSKAGQLTRDRGAAPTVVALDASGEIGRLYNARVTPHMFVIDGSGRLVCMGGIDDRPSARPSDIDGATNYVPAALADVEAGRAVVTRPYGCSVKYGS